jgi:hypothetical protein
MNISEALIMLKFLIKTVEIGMPVWRAVHKFLIMTATSWGTDAPYVEMCKAKCADVPSSNQLVGSKIFCKCLFFSCAPQKKKDETSWLKRQCFLLTVSPVACNKGWLWLVWSSPLTRLRLPGYYSGETRRSSQTQQILKLTQNKWKPETRLLALLTLFTFLTFVCGWHQGCTWSRRQRY